MQQIKMNKILSPRLRLHWFSCCGRASKMGFEAVIIDDLSNSSLGVLGKIEEITGIKPGFEKIDLKEKHDVARFFNQHADIDGIIHFAASKAVGESGI